MLSWAYEELSWALTQPFESSPVFYLLHACCRGLVMLGSVAFTLKSVFMHQTGTSLTGCYTN